MKSVIREQNKIRVFFVNMTNDDNAFAINFEKKNFKRYRVLFIEIKLLKHENHDTQKLLTSI